MWGSTEEGKRLPTWPGETSPRAVQPHRGLLAARPPRGAGGDAAPGLGPRPRRRDRPGRAAPWLHTQGLRLASWLQDTASPSLLLPSFLYLSCSNMQAVTLHQGQRFASLFYKYFYSPFFLPGVGCQIGSRMNAAGRERGAEEPGTEHVSRGVGLGRAV